MEVGWKMKISNVEPWIRIGGRAWAGERLSLSASIEGNPSVANWITYAANDYTHHVAEGMNPQLSRTYPISGQNGLRIYVQGQISKHRDIP